MTTSSTSTSSRAPTRLPARSPQPPRSGDRDPPIPIHRSEAYAGLGLDPGSLPVVERLAERICSLPMFPGMSLDETNRVARAVMGFVPDAAEPAAAGGLRRCRERRVAWAGDEQDPRVTRDAADGVGDRGASLGVDPVRPLMER